MTNTPRPTGNNADEWHEWFEDHRTFGSPYLAVQIAEALDAAAGWQSPDNEAGAEEAECAHTYLDSKGVSSETENGKLSLVGRIECYVSYRLGRGA